jgi:uncharacterized protein YoxC
MTNPQIIILILLSLLVLLLILFAVPLLIQLRRTAKGLEETAAILNRNLPGIMANLQEITTGVNRTTATVQREIGELSLTLRRVQGIVGVLLGVGEVVMRRMSSPLARNAMTALAVAKGVRTFIGVMTDRSPDGRGRRDQYPRSPDK